MRGTCQVGKVSALVMVIDARKPYFDCNAPSAGRVELIYLSLGGEI